MLSLCWRWRGTWTFKWDEVKDVKLSLQDDTDGYRREGIALLMKDEWLQKIFHPKFDSGKAQMWGIKND